MCCNDVANDVVRTLSRPGTAWLLASTHEGREDASCQVPTGQTGIMPKSQHSELGRILEAIWVCTVDFLTQNLEPEMLAQHYQFADAEIHAQIIKRLARSCKVINWQSCQPHLSLRSDLP